MALPTAPAMETLTNETTLAPATTTLSNEQKLELIMEHIWPKPYLWFLIACHFVVFVVGLVGNALVCIAVCRNHTMRTVTNIFIVNLAVADFLVLLFCLPPSVAVDVTQTWFFGRVGCKVILSLQRVSVVVSVLTLVFISLDRWYALCYPLRFRATARWAKKAIAIIWILSISLGVPYVVWTDVQPHEWSPEGTVYYSSCAPTWSGQTELYLDVFFFVCLYLLPLLFMTFTYCQIVRVLWRQAIPGHVEARDYSIADGSCRGTLMSQSGSEPVSAHIRSRRKAAKMLVIVVIIFAICLLFVHLIIVIRAALGEGLTQLDEIHGKMFQTATLVSHWLFYFNSAINPVIYNFMSSKFRREFRKAMCRTWESPLGAHTDDNRTHFVNSSIVDRRSNDTVTLTTSSSRKSRRLLAGRANANAANTETKL